MNRMTNVTGSMATPGTIRVRPIGPADREPLTRFYAGLSPDSREARFFGATPGIGERTARFFCGPDHEHREGIVAEATDADGGSTIVGHVCLEPVHSDRAEMAIAVADDWRRHGIGRAMLEASVEWAAEHEIHGFVASMRSSNTPIMALVRSMGLPVTLGAADGGVVDVVIDLRAVHRPAA